MHHVETESRYPVKESTIRLTREQREAAKALLDQRPPVIPGTRCILNREAAQSWFRQVSATIKRFELPENLVNAFCDVAGVPD